MKDRGAIFAAGKRPDAALWFDEQSGRFVTSSAFAQVLPEWVASFNHGMARYWSKPWTRVDRAWVESTPRRPICSRGARPAGPRRDVRSRHRSRREPPRLLTSPPSPTTRSSISPSPESTQRRPGGTRYLGVSLSAFDYVGHTFGPDSHESWDELNRLDASLKAFFATLDRRFPKGYSVMLSADHGAPPLPETASIPGARPWCDHGAPDRFQRPCGPSARVAANPFWISRPPSPRRRSGPTPCSASRDRSFSRARLSLLAERGARSLLPRHQAIDLEGAGGGRGVRRRANSPRPARREATSRSSRSCAAPWCLVRVICTSCSSRAAASTPATARA